MSTQNIGFYEDLTKIIFQLSSNMHLISSSEVWNNKGADQTVWLCRLVCTFVIRIC